MRTNIVLDEELVEEAFRYTNVTTKRDLIDLALREFLEHHKRRNVRDLRGSKLLDDHYDYKSLRSEEDPSCT